MSRTKTTPEIVEKIARESYDHGMQVFSDCVDLDREHRYWEERPDEEKEMWISAVRKSLETA